MTRPPRLCACGKVVPHGIACACQMAAKRARGRRHDARRPSARERGYDSTWRLRRSVHLAYNPCCARCGAPATVVDHKVPHRGDRALFDDPANLQSLCKPCHDGWKQRQEREGGQ